MRLRARLFMNTAKSAELFAVVHVSSRVASRACINEHIPGARGGATSRMTKIDKFSAKTCLHRPAQTVYWIVHVPPMSIEDNHGKQERHACSFEKQWLSGQK